MHPALVRKTSFGLRTLAVSALVAVVTLGFAAPANAAGATGTVDLDHRIDGAFVTIDGNRENTSLIPVVLDDGSRINTYCIDFTVEARDGARMVEDAWANYPNPSASFKAHPHKVNWILQRSFPNVPAAAMAGAAGVATLTEKQAIAATQAAIWYFSNGKRLDETGNHPAVLAVYRYLTGPANVGRKHQPLPTLSISPAAVHGKAGQRIGPFTVRSNVGAVSMRLSGPAGTRLVNSAGAAVSRVKAGSTVWVDVPAGTAQGSATLHATVTMTMESGRLFRGAKGKTQTLITATKTTATATANATLTWKAGPAKSPAPSPTASETTSSPAPTTPPASGGGLPVTGARAGIVLALGLALLGGGTALTVLGRRRVKGH